MSSGEPIHDVHAHYYPPDYVAVVREVAEEAGSHGDTARSFLTHPIISMVPAFTGDLDGRIALMDAAGISVQVLSFASMNVWHPDASVRTRLVETFNDGCSQAVSAHPDRFRFLATLPFPYVSEAVREAARVRGLPGFVGYSMPTHVDTVPIDASCWSEVYAAMDEEPALVLLHPDGFCVPGALKDHGMEWAIGAPFEDTIGAVRLIAAGLLSRYPRMTWIVPHLGGTLPFLLHRLLWRWELEAQRMGTPQHDSASLERLMFDTANCSSATLRLAEEVLPADRIVFGSDFPFLDPEDLRRPVDLIRTSVLAADVGPGLLAHRLEPFLDLAPEAAQQKEATHEIT